jgi:AcrR family transcriptional regulator
MAQKKPPRRTRERILETSLALFNRDGEPNVATADIADEMNISPGNLYYHFANKAEIVAELYDALEVKLAPLLASRPGRVSGVEDLWLWLHLLFETMAQYRFLYRDLDDILSRHARVAARFARVMKNGESAVLELCDSLARAGALDASEREIAALARNVMLVSTYWMSFQRLERPRAAGVRDAGDPEGTRLDRAAYQVLSLLAPFLHGDDRRLIEQLGAAYAGGR